MSAETIEAEDAARRQLVAAVREMRKLQRMFFGGDRRPQVIQLAKAAETRVDRMLEQIDGPTGSLFDRRS